MDEPTPVLPAADFPAAGTLHAGYRRAEVDEFVADLRRALQHDPPTMAPYEVGDVRFPAARREDAYAMQPVDEFLDAAQELLRERHGGDAVAALSGHTSPVQSGRWPLVLALALVALVAVAALALL